SGQEVRRLDAAGMVARNALERVEAEAEPGMSGNAIRDLLERQYTHLGFLTQICLLSVHRYDSRGRIRQETLDGPLRAGDVVSLKLAVARNGYGTLHQRTFGIGRS